jgi:MYXO-CTERM domain-containing protein
MRHLSLRGALASAALLAVAAPALAQDDLAEKAKEVAEQANDVQAQAGALANEALNAEAARDSERNGDRDRRDGVDGAAANAADDAGDGDDDGDSGKWGLLGLLGLAGLLGLRKRNDQHVRVDPLHDRRP